jgi:adenylate cyclase
MEPELSVDDLRARTDAPAELVRACVEAGLVEEGGDPPRFGALDVERLRMVGFLVRRGFGLDQIAEAERDEGFLTYWVGELSRTTGWPSVPLAEIAERTGLDPAFLRRIRDTAGLAGDGDLVTSDDAAVLEGLGLVLDAGVSEDELVEMVKVYADALSRVAEAEVRLFHFYVHERLRAGGLNGDKLRAASDEASERLQALIEPTLLYFHRLGMAKAFRADAVLHLADATGTLPPAEHDAQLTVAVVFVDLANFTALTETMGDATAATVLARFSDLVRTCVARHDGTLVKQIGDAFMLVFSMAGDAVRCGLDIEEAASREPRFLGTRIGAHWGPALYRAGDYVGAAVNLAARITAEAQPHQLLVSAELRAAAGDLAGIAIRALDARRLKGITDDIEVFEVRATVPTATDRVVDPVCGMELTDSDVVARLNDDGQERSFCSTDCLQRYLAASDRYP